MYIPHKREIRDHSHHNLADRVSPPSAAGVKGVGPKGYCSNTQTKAEKEVPLLVFAASTLNIEEPG
jgi:hypothetical protein